MSAPSDTPRPPPVFKEILPRKGLLHQEDVPTYALCKPKLMPLKSFTLEKLEKVQKEAQEKVKAHRDLEEDSEDQ